MRRGYNSAIRAEAISLRTTGRPWEDIQEMIYKKHKVKPSIRQMYNWCEDFREGNDDPAGEKMLAQIIRERLDNAITLADGRSRVMAMGFSWWLGSPWGNQQDLDIDTSIMKDFYLQESHVGRKTFDRALLRYQKCRDEIIEYMQGLSDIPEAADFNQPDNTEYTRDE